MTYTQSEHKILTALLTAENMTITSLYRLSIDLGLSYANAWRATKGLELMGAISLSRPRGRELCLSLRKQADENRGQFSRPGWGSTNPKLLPAIRNTQGETEMQNYSRPDLTPEEEAKYRRSAIKINLIPDHRLRLIPVAALVYENVRLLKEVNEHRAARGLELLPVYDPEAK